MYKVYKGDSCDFYKKHREEVKGKAKLVYLDPPYNSKRNRELENITMIVICCGRFLLVI